MYKKEVWRKGSWEENWVSRNRGCVNKRSMCKIMRVVNSGGGGKKGLGKIRVQVQLRWAKR